MADEQDVLLELLRQVVREEMQSVRGEMQVSLRQEIQGLRGEMQLFREEVNERFETVEHGLDEANTRLGSLKDTLDSVVEQTARTMEDVTEIRSRFVQLAAHQEDQSLDIRLLKRVVVADGPDRN